MVSAAKNSVGELHEFLVNVFKVFLEPNGKSPHITRQKCHLHVTVNLLSKTGLIIKILSELCFLWDFFC